MKKSIVTGSGLNFGSPWLRPPKPPVKRVVKRPTGRRAARAAARGRN